MIDKMDFLLNVLSSLGTIVALAALTYQVVTEKKEKRQEQANEVSTWIDNMYNSSNEECSEAVVICNHSNHPVYEVVFSIDDLYSQNGAIGTGEENCFCIDTLPPGKYVAIVEFGGHGMNGRFNSSITFRDHFGKYWTRNVNGKLILEKGENVISEKRHVDRPYTIVTYEKISD